VARKLLSCEAHPGLYEIAEVIDGDDEAVAQQRRHLPGKASGVEVEYDQRLVLAFREGQAIRVGWFADREAVLEAAGLRE
jgi:ketosteroid isomerase-like protein